MDVRQQLSIVKKWVNALRSGQYKQARSYWFGIAEESKNKVEVEHGYCCLGVLAEVCGMNLKDSIECHRVTQNQLGITVFPSTNSVPLTNVFEEIRPSIPDFFVYTADIGSYIWEINEILNNLAIRNDEGVPFSAIADTIELKIIPILENEINEQRKEADNN